MGIGFVLVLYGIAALIGSVVGGAVFGNLTRTFLRGSAEQTRLVRKATFLPAKCAAWAVLIFAFQALVNVTLLHRDAGLGDEFYVRLPDGYAIYSIDVTDSGLVYKAGPQLDGWSPPMLSDGVADTRLLQMSGKFLAGASDTHLLDHFGQPGEPVDHYFAIDTQSNKRADFATEQELRQWGAAHDFQLRLEPISDFYQRYRWTWFDGLALALLLLPPAISFCLLGRAILKARHFLLPNAVTISSL